MHFMRLRLFKVEKNTLFLNLTTTTCRRDSLQCLTIYSNKIIREKNSSSGRIFLHVYFLLHETYLHSRSYEKEKITTSCNWISAQQLFKHLSWKFTLKSWNIEHQTLMTAIAVADRKLMMVNNSSQFISYLSCENSIKKLPQRE